MSCEEKIVKLLRETDKPLTFDEVVEKSGLDRAAVKSVMATLVQKGLIKAFLREENGKTKAVYIIL